MRFAIVAAVTIVTGCSQQAGTAFTLYRNSPLDPAMRIHVATFDTSEGASYNDENCRLAADLFQAQDGVATRFWCEKGRFKQ